MHLTADQIDALKELLNIGVGRAAGALNQMLETPIHLQVPSLKLGTLQELTHELGEFGEESLSTVQLPFQGNFSGSASLIFPTESAAKLVDTLTGQAPDSQNLDTIRVGTLTEIGNIVLNGVMGSLTNVLKEQITYSVPLFSEAPVTNLFTHSQSNSNALIMLANARFTLEQFQIYGDIVVMFGVGSINSLLEAINSILSPQLENS